MAQEAVITDGKPLSQIERVVDTFVAPSKTFDDIRRSTSWWLPFVLVCIVLLFFSFAVDHTVGFASVAEHNIAQRPAQADQLQQLPPAERAQRMGVITTWTRSISYATPLIVLLFVAIEALILWGSFNFGLAAKTTFGQMFAVILFAGLPRLFIHLLAGILLFAGVNTENFDLSNPVGTNLGYFLGDSPKWLQTAGSFFDIFSLWSLALLVIGTAIVARKTKGQAAAIVVGWWLLILLVSTAVTAVMS